MPLQLHPFRPRLLDALKGYDRRRFVADLGAGLTVGIVALPLAMAFAIASGVKPEQGIFTAIVGGFIVSAFGGSQVQIGGPAGAFIVIVYGIVQRYGLTNLLISTFFAGVLLAVMGALKLGALVRYIPVSIVIGFTNGIAVLIGLSQVKDLLGLRIESLPADFFTQIGVLVRHLDTINPAAVAIGFACLALVWVWPKPALLAPQDADEPRWHAWVSRVPGTVVALVVATVATALLHLPVETIGSRFGGIPQSLPSLELPAFSWQSAKELLIPTVTIALLGAIESLLCARVADNFIDAPRHDPNQELVAQGIANMASPLVGGLPVTGTIARTMTNARAGAATPIAGIVHAVVLLLVVLVAAPLAVHVPLAALAGILLYIAWNMGEWREFGRLRHFSMPYRTILVGTFALTVIFDLTVAVEVGLILACVFFIYRMSTLFRVEPGAESPPGVQVYRLYGSLFFGAVAKLEGVADTMPPGTRAVVLEMHRLVSLDTSGLDALEQLHRALTRQEVRLLLCDVNVQPLGLMRRSGFEALLGEDNLWPDLALALAAAEAQSGDHESSPHHAASPAPQAG